jgi:aminoglycoside phosphotransferase
MNSKTEAFPSNISSFESKVSEDSDDELTLDFDVKMLQQLVSSRLDRHCVSTRKLTRGANNEIHLLQFDNGPDCIARLSRTQIHSEAKFASEVATMRYVAQNTKIKVPEVYDWDCSTQNIIKTPYILMERLPGQPLFRILDELTIKNKMSVLSQIIDILFELWTKCQFEMIGSLYMENDSLKLAENKASYSTRFVQFYYDILNLT